ncbi:type II toxin-antitoxin system RelE/ParE family toxin [Acidisoma sp. 7E03]
MPRYVLSRAARQDLEEIALYGIKTWGKDRAEAYLNDLEGAFVRLVQFPLLGRDVSYIRPGYSRADHGLHSIFYRQSEPGVVIIRILHRRMNPDWRL